MNFFETRYLLWYYGKQPKYKILNNIGERLHNKLQIEQEKKQCLIINKKI